MQLLRALQDDAFGTEDPRDPRRLDQLLAARARGLASDVERGTHEIRP